MISINGYDWEPHPDIAPCRSKADGNPVFYRHDYATIVKGVATADAKVERDTYRALMLKDLWFLLYFGMGYRVANHPFWVTACRELEEGPEDFTLDLWAREHGKSSIITKGETVQFILRNPEKSTGIFAYAKPLAKKFLMEIKETFATNVFLRTCFPDVIWKNCEKESPLWALDEGIILKRKTNMAEPTVSAWGLTEGMPTGMHFDRRVYDDISTQDSCKTVEMMEDIKMKFDVSQNIGKDGGHHRVVGTFYHHNDPLVYVRGKKNPDGTKKYHVRMKPATDDGTAKGRPVYLSQKRLDVLKGDLSFNCQQLLNPTPEADQRLNPEFLKAVKRADVPRDAYRVMLLDQAGDMASNKMAGGDAWAIALCAVEKRADNIGQANVYIEDLWINPSNESEAIEQAVRMYLAAGVVNRFGIEKVGTVTTHLHIAAALKAHGRYIAFADKDEVGVLLRPAGRTKAKMIEGALSWPLNNGKLHYTDAVAPAYIDRLKLEMTNFPLWHDDGLNALAYLYDVLRDPSLSFAMAGDEELDEFVAENESKPVDPAVGY